MKPGDPADKDVGTQPSTSSSMKSRDQGCFKEILPVKRDEKDFEALSDFASPGTCRKRSRCSDEFLKLKEDEKGVEGQTDSAPPETRRKGSDEFLRLQRVHENAAIRVSPSEENDKEEDDSVIIIDKSSSSSSSESSESSESDDTPLVSIFLPTSITLKTFSFF